MQINSFIRCGLAWAFCSLAVPALRADRLDDIGARLLWQVDPTLRGNGVTVAQVEGAEGPTPTNTPPNFEVNPATVNQPVNLFTWISDFGSATNFPNSVGGVSGHAGGVAAAFYGANGVAPQVAHVDNYDADHFYSGVIIALPAPPTIPARIVNQSFIFANGDLSHYTTNDEQEVESAYDYYAAQHNTLFVSGAGNGGRIYPAATCYNGIGVAVSDGASSYGPTLDGRSKPDLTAPGGATSFSTPLVSGAATVLLQAAMRGDGGSATATNARALKALLLNGAVKPAGWTNSPATPLDGRYGAGIVNVFNSWKQLTGGKRAFIEATSNASGGAHPPGANTNNIASFTGWDHNSLTTSGGQERVNHYYFNLPAAVAETFTLTATLVWNRPAGALPGSTTDLNNLNLFLINTATSNLVVCSTSAVDNVEHLYLPALPAGRYDLQVLKNSAGPLPSAETYALAFEFFTMPLSLTVADTNLVLSWPLAPAGFRLEFTTGLAPPITWFNVNAAVAISNDLNQVMLPLPDAQLFFRLKRP